MNVWTTAIRGLNGRNDPFPCSLMRLRQKVFDSSGQRWQPAQVFHGLGSPTSSVVNAAKLFIDKNCTVPVIAKLERTAPL